MNLADFVGRVASKSMTVEDIDTLKRNEIARRIILLRMLRNRLLNVRGDEISEQFDRDTLLSSFEILSTCYHEDVNKTVALLMYPQVGTWMAYTMRRLSHPRKAHTPLWVHIGQLNSLAFSAAITTGQQIKTRLPVWQKAIHLPSLGMIPFNSTDDFDVADAEISSDTISLNCKGETKSIPLSLAAPSTNVRRRDLLDCWIPSVRIETNSNGVPLSVYLDDSDPYRESFGPNSLPTEPLSDEQIEKWRMYLQAAWELLTNEYPERASEISQIICAITPTLAEDRFNPRSSSSSDAFGGIVASLPANSIDFAHTLIHEIQHSKLNGLIHLEKLTEDSDDLFHAPWRDDPRPLMGLIHGIYSFSAVTEFWNIRRSLPKSKDSNIAHFSFALWRQNTRQCIEKLTNHPALTTLGQRFLEVMRDRSDELATEVVPTDIQLLASRIALDHYLTWRLHHIEPNEHTITAIIDAWTRQSSLEINQLDLDGTITPKADISGLDVRGTLSILKFLEPDEFDNLFNDLETLAKTFRGTLADLHLVNGNLKLANSLYLDDLKLTEDFAQTWSGIFISSRTSPLNSMSTKHPEIVAATAERLELISSPTQTLEFLSWLNAFKVS